MDQIEPAPVTWTWQRAIGAWESHAFRREGPGWMTSACKAVPWTARFAHDPRPRKCLRCAAVVEAEAVADAPKRELTELELLSDWAR
jgi:hypothetical protein